MILKKRWIPRIWFLYPEINFETKIHTQNRLTKIDTQIYTQQELTIYTHSIYTLQESTIYSHSIYTQQTTNISILKPIIDWKEIVEDGWVAMKKKRKKLKIPFKLPDQSWSIDGEDGWVVMEKKGRYGINRKSYGWLHRTLFLQLANSATNWPKKHLPNTTIWLSELLEDIIQLKKLLPNTALFLYQ